MKYNHQIAVIGLGYVGLPLALEFSKLYPVIGFDINAERVNELNNGIDRTQEADMDELRNRIESFKPSASFMPIYNEPDFDFSADGILELESEFKSESEFETESASGFETELAGDSALAMDTLVPIMERGTGLFFSTDQQALNNANTYIVTVPTPIDHFKKPDLAPLLKASQLVGSVLKKGDIVIYESTVYPGCTEEDCVPVLEKVSGLKYNIDFFCGYSPERINPGDKINTLTKIKKVTSGSTPEIAQVVNNLYGSIITAGTHLAPTLKVAEASKAIENAQRDINISFVNELALIFDKMGIDTSDVIEAAATKWNFLKYQPGLVGGHCIGVDPYYLAHKAESLGYHPEVILSGRRVNDHMGQFVANKVIKLMIQKNHKIKGAKALIIGFTFKENCPDIRNSRVIDIYQELIQYGLDVDVYDPWVDKAQVASEYGIALLDEIEAHYDALILAVSHDAFVQLDYSLMTNCDTVIFDAKSVMPRELVDGRL